MWNSSASGRKLVMRSAKVGSGAAAKRHELTRRRTVTGRALVQLDVGLLNNRGERLALLASEVCKGLAGKAGELDCKGIEAFAYIRLLADGIQFRGQLVDNDLRHADRSDPSEPGLHLEALQRRGG